MIFSKSITATAFCVLNSIAVVAQSRPYAPELFPAKTSGAVCGFSADGKRIYFVREDTVTKKLFIYQARRHGDQWVDVTLIPFSGKYNDMGGRLTKDGKTFYFTSDRPGGSEVKGDVWNIWVSRLSDGRWGSPEPMLAVNNQGMECCAVPFGNNDILFSGDRDKVSSWWISRWSAVAASEQFVAALNEKDAWQWPSSFSSSGDILFLNSMKRAGSHGADDIYVALYRDGVWSVPVNLGGAVNSASYEDGAILSPDESLLIFCRHDTATTPSRVLCVDWKPVAASLPTGNY